MVEHGSGESASGTVKRRNRRTYSGSKRRRVLYVLLSDNEHAVVSRAAEREHLATAAWAALTLLAAATGKPRTQNNELREVLQAVMQVRGQAHRIGVNLNQAVAALNSGEVSSTIQWYARAAAQTIRKLDELADELRRRLP
ncbi:hypothetical protein [Actinomadura opuntiae]|uniref:hypothetical protein n=1 Tax=Actinomadura sp. OS1-43 TaxID=604315 RepID=UPI00255AA476|nr:hypothetical protein [Actinomadura sp. OS1-43]MDL4816929.1 hypothetical protein [Actinomadura sp. OS1-43]